MTDHVPNDLSHLSDEEFNALCPQGEHAPGPAMTDFRALCEELTDDLEGWYVCNTIGNDPAEKYTAATEERIHRARAVLARWGQS